MRTICKSLLSLSIVFFLLLGCSSHNIRKAESSVTIHINTSYTSDPHMADKVENMKKHKAAGKPLYEVYKDLPVIDVHNHQAGEFPSMEYEQYGIDKTVLFGNISEPAAIETDELSWQDYMKRPDLVYPSFAAVDIYHKAGLDYTKQNLEQGYLNIGELAAASTYSPVVSQLEWKGDTPASGNLGQVYDLAAKYAVPVLLHIDPENGAPIDGLERELELHPKTTIIFGHANVAGEPEDLDRWLSKYSNLYIDFYAGFTEFDEGSTHKLQDYIPIIEKYPNRFVFGTDSGYGITYDQAVAAIYDTIDLLSPKTAVKVAYQNYQRLIEIQPPTTTQIHKIEELAAKLHIKGSYTLNKRKANELIFRLEKELVNKDVHPKKKTK